MSEQTQEDREMRAINEALELLSRHFDWAHIFVGTHEGGDIGTGSIQKGIGDWYARYGKIKDWIVYTEEFERAKARRDFKNKNEDNDE